uniref:Uncharacterized protein n=1 Tax=Timema monikensis TaxID=170555 RepID=A0A7R9ELB5_9NEOP|nr:unnamed protein product [Timema monikensis]
MTSRYSGWTVPLFTIV